MKKGYYVAFGMVTIIASLFYAGIWTCESNTLSQCFILTGLVAVGHALISMIACAMVDSFE